MSGVNANHRWTRRVVSWSRSDKAIFSTGRRGVAEAGACCRETARVRHRRDRGRASSCLRLRLEMDLETIPLANGDRFARGAASVRDHKGTAWEVMEGQVQDSLHLLGRALAEQGREDGRSEVGVVVPEREPFSHRRPSRGQENLDQRSGAQRKGLLQSLSNLDLDPFPKTRRRTSRTASPDVVGAPTNGFEPGLPE